MTQPASTHPVNAPLSIARVALTVRDAGVVSAFYRDVVGLEPMGTGHEGLLLGAAGQPLLELVEKPSAIGDDPREAGLFHTAFLLPTRRALAEWAAEIALRRQNPVDGASDHLVSEAFYLTDPEGNGVEIYADRAPESWNWQNGRVEMATRPIDMNSLMEEVDLSDGQWRGAPEGTSVGHIHLRVGDLAESDSFYIGDVGFELATTYPGANFLSTGRYHHHVGTNIWHSARSPRRREDRSGLLWFEVADRRDGAKRQELTDPWGTKLHLVPAKQVQARGKTCA